MSVQKRVRLGETERNRPAAATALFRRYSKNCVKTDWYQETPEELDISEDPKAA